MLTFQSEEEEDLKGYSNSKSEAACEHEDENACCENDWSCSNQFFIRSCILAKIWVVPGLSLTMCWTKNSEPSIVDNYPRSSLTPVASGWDGCRREV